MGESRENVTIVLDVQLEGIAEGSVSQFLHFTLGEKLGTDDRLRKAIHFWGDARKAVSVPSLSLSLFVFP